MKDPGKFLLLLIVTLGVALAGSWVTFPSISTWYVTLNKPFFTPPNWVFGPAWTTLYILMTIAAYQASLKKISLNIYFFQLALNFLWSFVFFYLHNITGSFVIIVLLWLAILQMIKIFKKAGIWLYPYLGWVTFASLLNLSVAILNP